MKLQPADFLNVALRNHAAFHETVENRWFASNYFTDGSLMTGVHETVEEAAKEYCQLRDLMGEVLLTRIGNTDDQ